MSPLRRKLRHSFKGFFQAWFALIVAFPVGFILLTGVADLLVGVVDRNLQWAWPEPIHIWWTVGLFILSVALGPPFVLARHFIVKPRFPFLRWGFLPIAAVLPLLSLGSGIAGGASIPGLAYDFAGGAVFDIPLLACTLLFVAVCRLLGGFRTEAPEHRAVDTVAVDEA